MVTKDFAERLVQEGISVIPLWPGSKKPMLETWKEYQSRCATAEEIAKWFSQCPDAELAIVAGNISGLVAVDLDTPNAQQELAASRLPLPKTFTYPTTRGSHHWYRIPSSGVPVKTGAGIVPGVDVRGEGGYTRIPQAVLGATTPDQLVQALRGATALPVEWVTRLGVSQPTQIATVSNGGSVDELFANGADEGTRNASCARLAGVLLKKGVSPGSVRTILRDWGNRCRPPLKAAEVDEVVDSIAKREAAQCATEPEIEVVSAADLLTTHTATAIPMLVEGLVPERASGFIGGEPKVRKSYFALDLAYAVSTGTTFLQHFAVPTPQPVLFVAEEDPRRRIERRLQQLARAKGSLSIPSPVLPFMIRQGVNLDTQRGQNRFRYKLESLRPRLVIIDPFNRIHGSDENNTTEMSRLTATLMRLSDEFECGFLVVHHFRKTTDPRFRRLAGGELRGSNSLHGWADTSFYVKKKTDWVLQVRHEGKDVEHDEFIVNVRYEDALGNPTTDATLTESVHLTFAGKVSELRQKAENDSLAKVVAAVDELYAQHGREVTIKQVAEHIGIPDDAVRDLVARAAAGQLINRRNDGTAKKPAYKLSPTTPAGGLDS